MKALNSIISLFEEKDQSTLAKYAKLSGDEYYQAMLGFTYDISEQTAEYFSLFINHLVRSWKFDNNYVESKLVPEELSDIFNIAEDFIEGLGFEYHWNKKTLSDECLKEYQVFEEKLRKEGIEFSNIIINKAPNEMLDCLLDYGDYCEVFYFKNGEKKKLKTFNNKDKAKDYYRELLLAKPEYFLRKIHYKFEDDKVLAMHYAQVLNDEISYDILKNNIQLKDEKMAYDFSCFFWDMIDLVVEDYHANRTVAGVEPSDCEFLLHSIGGFVISSGYSYQWYREESTPERLEIATRLEADLKEADIDMSKVIINAEPQDGCYCFLDYGDYHQFTYQKDDEEHEPKESYKIRDFDKAIEFFKNWVIEELGKP